MTGDRRMHGVRRFHPTDPLTAPSKALIWFEESGHETFVDEPAELNASKAELMRPRFCR